MSSRTLNQAAASTADGRSKPAELPWSSATTYLFLMLLGAVPYLNTLFNGFVYDDGFQVLKNSYLHSFRFLRQIFGTLAWSFQGTQGMTNYYRPLMTFFYLILYQLFGPLAYPFHLTNVILNVIVICAIFWVTWRLFVNRLTGFLAAALFAVHPIHTEVVAWVAAVSDLQLALALLLAFWCFLRLPETSGARWWLLRAGMGLGFTLGLLSKEPAAMLPVLATIFEYFYRDDRRATSFIVKLSRYAIFWAILGGYLYFRTHFLGAVVPIFQRPRLTWYEVFLTAITLIGQYIWKMIWPMSMSLFYPFKESTQLTDPRVWGGLAAIILCAALFLYLWKHTRTASFGLIWFFVFMAPVLNARWMAANVFAERYLFVPSLGLCWVAAWGAEQWWERARTRSANYRIVLASVFCLILALGTVRTVMRNFDWRDDLTLYSSTLRVFPKADLIRANLGAAQWNSGDHDAAEKQWREALRLSPDNVVAMGDLALAMDQQKRYTEAIELLKRAIELKPRYAAAHMALGDVYAEVEQIALAEAELRKSVELYPLNPESRNHLGALLMKQGRIREAEEQYLASVNSIPTYDGYDGLADIYFDRGERAKAEQAYRDAILDYPYDHHAHFRLGQIYAESGRAAEAIREYKAGLETDPNNAAAQAALRKLESGSATPSPRP
jgi:tetratricopeptide (TPR) repeat protein